MPKHLRVFISSPGDVPDERLRADLIVDKVAQDFSRFFTFESFRWEHEPMLASGHFQDAVDPPSHADIVILSTPEQKCIGLPEQKCISDARKKAPELGAFSSGIKLRLDCLPMCPS
jgi:hypothetical protein